MLYYCNYLIYVLLSNTNKIWNGIKSPFVAKINLKPKYDIEAAKYIDIHNVEIQKHD